MRRNTDGVIKINASKRMAAWDGNATNNPVEALLFRKKLAFSGHRHFDETLWHDTIGRPMPLYHGSPMSELFS